MYAEGLLWAEAGESSGSAAGSPPLPDAESGAAPDAPVQRRPDSGSQLRMSILRALRDEHTFVHHG